jgi:hypothetical protein
MPLQGKLSPVVYHGTVVPGRSTGTFRLFKKSERRQVSGTSDAGLGVWFTADYERAASAASDAKEVADDDSVSADVIPARLVLKNAKVAPTIRDLDPAESAAIIRKARRDGHDGVVFTEGEGNGADYIAFQESQSVNPETRPAVTVRTSPSRRA